MNLSRRKFVKCSLGAGAALALAPRALAADAKKIPIGLQLYSVRHACAEDLPGVLAKVAEFGYEGVEFAGYYGRTAEQLRKLLDENNLKCCGTHIGLGAITGDGLKSTVEFNQVLGNKYLIVAGMAQSYLESVQTIKDTAKQYNEAAERVRDLGMFVGYHAHGFDFKKVDGKPAWDIFFENTVDDVVMQLDIGNCLGGGGDPYATLERFPGRSKTVHLKEHGGPAEAVVGEGNVDWKRVFELCETVGGTEWYIVEHERGAGDPLDNVRRCLVNLREMGK